MSDETTFCPDCAGERGGFSSGIEKCQRHKTDDVISTLTEDLATSRRACEESGLAYETLAEEVESLRLALETATRERDEARTLAEQRGAAYDIEQGLRQEAEREQARAEERARLTYPQWHRVWESEYLARRIAEDEVEKANRYGNEYLNRLIVAESTRDLHWREVESLREWKDKLEAERDALLSKAAPPADAATEAVTYWTYQVEWGDGYRPHAMLSRDEALAGAMREQDIRVGLKCGPLVKVAVPLPDGMAFPGDGRDGYTGRVEE